MARALPLLGETFFVVNSDVFWLDGRDHALARLAAAFDPETMDAVLLLQRTATAVGYEGSGDYFLDPLGTPRRRGEREIAPYLFAGIQLLHRRAFDGIAGRALLAEPDLSTAPRPPAGCTRSCMTANGTMSARRTGWP